MYYGGLVSYYEARWHSVDIIARAVGLYGGRSYLYIVH